MHKVAYLCLLTYWQRRATICAMRTTIDIPDVLYKAVRSRTASEGTTLRYVMVALLGDWLSKPDWRPQEKTEYFIADDEPKAEEKPKTRLPFFGIVKPKKHINGPHDMESIRASIAEGRKKEYAELLARRGFI